MDTTHFQALLAKFESLVERLERVERAQGIAVPAQPAQPSSGGSSSQLNGLLKDFDNEVTSKIKPLEDAAAAIGGDIIPTIVRIYVLLK
jgi:hypothetical protein